jgi:hypothetical protein
MGSVRCIALEGPLVAWLVGGARIDLQLWQVWTGYVPTLSPPFQIWGHSSGQNSPVSNPWCSHPECGQQNKAPQDFRCLSLKQH